MKESTQVRLSFSVLIVFIALVVIGLSSCEHRSTVTLTREEYMELTNASLPEPFYFSSNSNSQKYRDWQIIKGSDGHSYIENTNSLFVLHSPECELCKSQQRFYLLDNQSNTHQNDTLK